MTTPFQDSREPITTRVVVRMEFETWMSWEHARMIDPRGMEHAIFLHATVHEDRTVDVSLEVLQDDLDYLIAAVGEEYVLSALEESISCDASEIIEAADLEEALRLMPVRDAVPPFDANTFAVTWSVSEAVMVREAIAEAENDLRHVKLSRMGREADKLFLAVTLPPHLADEVRAAGPAKAGAGFSDAVLEQLVGLIQEGASKDWSYDDHLPDDESPIPF